MSFVDKGVSVKVLSKDGKAHHGFREGDIVVSTGGGLELSTGDWTIFEDLSGFTQYLLPYHYEEAQVEKEVEVTQSVVDPTLPSKVVYGVVNSSNDIIASTFDRDYARELKAAMGGKRQGVRIFAFTATKEIR